MKLHLCFVEYIHQLVICSKGDGTKVAMMASKRAETKAVGQQSFLKTISAAGRDRKRKTSGLLKVLGKKS